MRFLCAATIAAIVCLSPPAAYAGVDPSVDGTVAASDGTPISGAHVILSSEHVSVQGTSDAKGRFHIVLPEPDVVTVTASAPGYNTVSGRIVDVPAGVTTLSLVLQRATTNSLTVIGEVRSTSGDSISTSSSPSISINAQAAAAQGTTQVSDMVWSQLSTTPSLALGGGSNALVSIAVRGPDPTETLVDIDGHQVNNGNTGDFNLSLLDPADLADVQVVYGISPSSLVGPNTLGGAVNVLTLQPTTTPQVTLRGFLGSFGSTGQTVDATGTSGRFGYVASLHRVTSDGSVNTSVVNSDGDTATVGSDFFGETLLSKLRYQLGDGYGYLQLSVRDQAANSDMSSLMTNYTPGTGYQTFEGTYLATHQANYGFDAVVPVGNTGKNPPSTLISFSHLTTLSQQSVTGPGAQTSPYLYNQRDLLGDDWLQIDHQFARGDLSLKYDLSTENLLTQYVPGGTHADAIPAGVPFDTPPQPATIPLNQTQRSLVLRYDGNPSSYIHYSIAAYDSNFSIFGNSFDPRVGLVWTPTARTAVRASVGTTFQAPQLTSLYVPPSPPPPVGGVITVGNPNLKPDRATEYDLGAEQIFGNEGRQLRLSLDFYRTNIRTPITLPVAPPRPPHCARHHDCPTIYPINAGDGVYRGFDIHAERQLGRQFVLKAGWDVDSSYLSAIPPNVQDGTLVAGQQTLGQPLHKAFVGFARDVQRGWVYGANLNYEGFYNELNRSPYATLDAHVAYRTGHFEIGAYGTNLTNVYASPFTVIGGGVPYGSLPGTPIIPTDAYVLQGAKIVVVATQRM